MIDMDSQDELPVFGEKGSEYIIGLYRKLIVSIDKPEFKRLVIQEKKYGLLNYIGVQWVFGSAGLKQTYKGQ